MCKPGGSGGNSPPPPPGPAPTPAPGQPTPTPGTQAPGTQAPGTEEPGTPSPGTGSLKLGSWKAADGQGSPLNGADYFMDGKMGATFTPPSSFNPTNWSGKTLFGFGGEGCNPGQAKEALSHIDSLGSQGFKGLDIDDECSMPEADLKALIDKSKEKGLHTQITVFCPNTYHPGEVPSSYFNKFPNLDYVCYMPYANSMNTSGYGITITADGTVSGQTMQYLQPVIDDAKKNNIANKVIIAATPWWMPNQDWPNPEETIKGWGMFLKKNGFAGTFFWHPTGYAGNLQKYIDILKKI
jgi:hypothetical protein